MDESHLEFISYHMKCYRSYIRKGERASKQLNNDDSDVAPVNPKEASNEKLKHTKSVTRSSSLNICIICNKHKQGKDTSRICEVSRAKLLLEARKFNLDGVYTRTSMLESIDVFAAVCHKWYKIIMFSNINVSYRMNTKFAFSNMISKLDLEKKRTLNLSNLSTICM